MRKFAVCLFFLIAVSIQAQLVTKKEFRLGNNDRTFFLNNKLQKPNSRFEAVSSQKSLLLAGTLSFIVPGAALGQFYKEEYLNGTIRLSISVLSAAWFFIAPPLNFEKGGSSSQKVIAAIIFAGNWIVSVFDASSGGKSKNVTKRRYPYRYIVF